MQGPDFNDVANGSFAADWINELYANGCGNGDYCPDASVTRAQMAVFQLKTLVGSFYTPPFGSASFGARAPSHRVRHPAPGRQRRVPRW